MEEYMESELSGIFRVKLVTKNIERGSSGTQFMHMRVKESWKQAMKSPCLYELNTKLRIYDTLY